MASELKEKKSRPVSRSRTSALKRELPSIAVCGAFIIVEAWFFISLLRSKLVAPTYLVLIAAGLLLFGALVYFLCRNFKKKVRFASGALIALVLSIGLIYASSLVNKVVDTIEDFIPETTTEVSYVQVGVFVMKGDTAQALEELKDSAFGIVRVYEREETDRALAQLTQELGTSLTVREYEGFMQAVRAMMAGEVRAVVLDPAWIDAAKEFLTEMDTPADFRQLTEVRVAKGTEAPGDTTTQINIAENTSAVVPTLTDPSETLPEETSEIIESSEAPEGTEESGTNKSTNPPAPPKPTTTAAPTKPPTAAAINSPDASRIFTVYIQGIDSRNGLVSKSRSDVNILAVVNMNSKQCLLITTPRDTYVPFEANEWERDKLTHAGWYGVWGVIGTLRMLYGVQADYYFRCDFHGFTRVIDAIGGITIYSDRAFTAGTTTKTVEVLVPGTNAAGEPDPEAESVVSTQTQNVPLYEFVQGNNNLDGAQALAFVRERKAFGGGDGIRGLHQMDVIKAILYKVMSGSTLSNLSGVLGALSGAFEANLSYDLMASIIRSLQSGGWNITSYSINGRGSTEYCPMLGGRNYVLWPNQDSVDYAKTLIRKVYNGEWVSP